MCGTFVLFLRPETPQPKLSLCSLLNHLHCLLSSRDSTTTAPQLLADQEFDINFEKAKEILNLPEEADPSLTNPTNFQSLLSKLTDVADKGDPKKRFEKMKKVDSLLVKFMEVNKERAEADMKRRRQPKTNPVQEQRDKLATIIVDLHKSRPATPGGPISVTPSTTVIVGNKGKG